jgi:hypothetical protein
MSPTFLCRWQWHSSGDGGSEALDQCRRIPGTKEQIRGQSIEVLSKPVASGNKNGRSRGK